MIIVDDEINACLNPSTKYVNGNTLNSITKLPLIIFKFQIIGVNHMNSCIIMLSNCPKSGTIVESAEVNLVNEIIKHSAHIMMYITIKIFGKNQNEQAAIQDI